MSHIFAQKNLEKRANIRMGYETALFRKENKHAAVKETRSCSFILYYFNKQITNYFDFGILPHTAL